MVAQGPLEALVKVRILAGQPLTLTLSSVLHSSFVFPLLWFLGLRFPGLFVKAGVRCR
jgi:hypothetical protein